MPFRDELEAARARVAMLEARVDDLSAAEERAEQLESRLKLVESELEKARAKELGGVPRRSGRRRWPWILGAVVVVGTGALFGGWIRTGGGGRSIPRPASSQPSTWGLGCSEGTHFEVGKGCVRQPVVVTPGRGMGTILVGHAIPADVLAAFGEDCKVSQHAGGETYDINYAYDGSGRYDAARFANRSRPDSFRFKHGVLQSIHVGAHQQYIQTPGGLDARSNREGMIRELGDHYELEKTDTFDKYLYRRAGIEVWVYRVSGKVNSFIIHVPQD